MLVDICELVLMLVRQCEQQLNKEKIEEEEKCELRK